MSYNYLRRINKKGSGIELGWEQILEIVLVLGFLVLILIATPRLFATYFGSQKEMQAKGTLDTLSQKLNSLNEGETISYFLFAPSGWKIVAFDAAHNENKEFAKPSKYFGQNTLCVCEKKCKICQTIKLPLKQRTELALIKIELKELWLTNAKEYFNVSNEKLTEVPLELTEEETLTSIVYSPSNTKIDEWLKSKNSPMAGLGQCIIDTSTKTQVPPELILAVAIHESNWGKSDLAQQCKNLFGIKSHKTDCEMMTSEHLEGKYVRVKAPFMRYNNACQSINYFGKLISTSKYYTEAMKYINDPIMMAYAIHGCTGPYAGKPCIYATDPEWASKIINYINEIKTAQIV